MTEQSPSDIIDDIRRDVIFLALNLARLTTLEPLDGQPVGAEQR